MRDIVYSYGLIGFRDFAFALLVINEARWAIERGFPSIIKFRYQTIISLFVE